MADHRISIKIKNPIRLCFWLILLAGIAVRCYQFGAVPGGINQDEAFAGYEAWSLLKYGIDTAGYHNPVYLTAWGSGMNALESYLMMPLIALFGLETWVIRLPQLIVACLSLWVVFLLMRRLFDEKIALLSMFLLAICPWHIMMARWGLESNLAPGFLLFGLYFFVAGLDKPRFLILSALLYGLSLYTYATYWIYIPFILLFQAIYCARCGKLHFDRYVLFSVLILALMALPLLLFLAINNGLMEEVRLSFLSIPKLLYMRSGEISLDQKQLKLQLLADLLLLQNDGEIWNSPDRFGLFYYLSAPFAVFGLVYSLLRIVRCTKERRFSPELLLLIQVLVSLPQGLLVKVNATKLNILFIPLMILVALGIRFACSLTFRRVQTFIVAAYAVLFLSFSHYYFTEYEEACKAHFDYGLEEALDAAMEREGHIYMEAGIFYPKVLFYSQLPVDRFRETVEYYAYPAPYLVAVEFDRFSLWANPYEPDLAGTYILHTGADFGNLKECGFQFEEYGLFTVAYKQENIT